MVSDYDELIKKKNEKEKQLRKQAPAKISDKENASVAPSTVSTTKSHCEKDQEDVSLLDLAMQALNE